MKLESTPVILLFAALPSELRPLRRKLNLELNKPAAVPVLADQMIVAVASGIGQSCCTAELDLCLQKYQPQLVINLGLAGGLKRHINAGTVVRVRTVCDPNGNRIHIDDPKAHGTLLTVDKSANTTAMKAELYTKHQADIVDMESYYIAQRLKATGTRLRIIRAVSDPADFAFPAGLLGLISLKGYIKYLHTISFFITHPKHIPCAAKLNTMSKLALNNLVDTVMDILNEENIMADHGTIRL